MKLWHLILIPALMLAGKAERHGEAEARIPEVADSGVYVARGTIIGADTARRDLGTEVLCVFISCAVNEQTRDIKDIEVGADVVFNGIRWTESDSVRWTATAEKSGHVVSWRMLGVPAGSSSEKPPVAIDRRGTWNPFTEEVEIQ